MTAEVLTRLAEAWAVAAGLQLALWLVQLRTRNAGIVDVGWALAFTPVVAVFAWQSTSCAYGWGVIAAVVVVWSGRLGGYLLSRGAATGPEEGRYAELRTRWSQPKFLVFFQAQAALTAVLSAAFVVPFLVEPSALWPRALGASISIAGIAGEAIADAQLARFKRAPGNKGRVCDVGLWSWSRHPNYFFEWCVWVRALYGIAFGTARPSKSHHADSCGGGPAAHGTGRSRLHCRSCGRLWSARDTRSGIRSLFLRPS